MRHFKTDSRDHSRTSQARLVETAVETTGQDLQQTIQRRSILSVTCGQIFR